jgi:pilus assembly protein CpaF
MALPMNSSLRGNDAREAGWVNRLYSQEGYTPEYQEFKFTLHRKLLDRINLEALSSMASERVRTEIRAAVAKLVEEEKTPLSLVEKSWTRSSASGRSSRCCRIPPSATFW